MGRRRIAIVSPYVGELFKESPDRAIGGAEIQVFNLGTMFCNLGHCVDILSSGIEEDSDVRLFESGGKLRLVRISMVGGSSFMSPISLFQRLHHGNYDSIVVRGAMYGAEISFISSVLGVPLVVFAASDLEVDLCRRGSILLPATAIRLGLMRAARIICQNNEQLEYFRTINRSSVLVRSIFFINGELGNKAEMAAPRILWVGRMDQVKRPELAIQLARTMPEFEFIMVGGLSLEYPQLMKEISESSATVPNIVLTGAISRKEVLELMKESMAIINTSTAEGFPNVFIEAWSLGIPVVTLGIDPDNVIQTFNLGYRTHSLQEMREKIIELSKLGAREQFSFQCRRYVSIYHDSKSLEYDLMKLM